jgi:plasmid stabilization system protein ParE
MVYQLIFKKRFLNKVERLLNYIEKDFGLLVAQKFAKQLDKKLLTLQKQPLIGKPSLHIPNVRSIHVGKHNRLYYRSYSDNIVILNMYDTRINPKRNTLK